MSIGKDIFHTLKTVTAQREWQAGQKVMNELADVYEGHLPAEYDRYFPKSSPKHIINITRLAHDDLAGQIGKHPEFRAEPINDSRRERKAAQKIEHIAMAYLRHAAPSSKQFLWQLSWWILLGRAVALVIPDKDNKMPRMEMRDPRTCYPGIAKMAGNQIVELSDLIFVYKVPTETAKEMGLDVKIVEDQWGRPSVPTECEIVEYIDDTQHMIVSDGGTVIRTEHNLGMVPGWVFQTFAPNNSWGVSQFQDQLTFMVAISQLVSMKIAQAERTVYPIYWVKGHEGTLDLGPNSVNKLSPTGDMGMITPPTEIQADRDVQMLERFGRILNRNPESRQGEVAGSGYVSAKTIESLNESIDTVVTRHWDVIGYGIQKLIAACFMMDEKHWPNTEKHLHLNHKGKQIKDTYTPKEDIAGRYHIEVDYGFGLGGYQGFLQNVQAMDAGLLPRRRVIEEMPGIYDVEGTLRQIELENMDEAGNAMFLALAQQGQLDTVIWAKLRKEMAEKGLPLHEVVIKYEEMLREQANQAMEQGGAETMTAAEAPQDMGPQAPPGPPGLPPGIMAGAGIA